ncbi:MAG: amidohydrolase family protein, partial [Alphaproteobacteria bacterium]|nr:amidohydrolase family protein [Alphaproteobacteria bacterium]
ASAETCTHYLALTDEVYHRPDAHLWVMSPPLRDAAHQARLWRGVANGEIAAVTSDDASYSAAAKKLGSASFATTANGIPGVEHRLPLLYTLGVEAGRIDLATLAEIWATGPARLFGLAPRKGAIAAGADADLVIIDPAARRRMDASCNFGDIGYTAFEGLELAGWPVLTLRCGVVAVEQGRFLGKAGDGRYLERGLSIARGA